MSKLDDVPEPGEIVAACQTLIDWLIDDPAMFRHSRSRYLADLRAMEGEAYDQDALAETGT